MAGQALRPAYRPHRPRRSVASTVWDRHFSQTVRVAVDRLEWHAPPGTRSGKDAKFRRRAVDAPPPCVIRGTRKPGIVLDAFFPDFVPDVICDVSMIEHADRIVSMDTNALLEPTLETTHNMYIILPAVVESYGYHKRLHNTTLNNVYAEDAG